MKIILESELERYAWETMMEAHRGWEKNHGDIMRDHMEWYFDGALKTDTDEAIKAEVERRLDDEFADDLSATEEEYVVGAMSEHEDPDKLDYDLASLVENPDEEFERMRQERQEWEEEYRQEYRDLQEQIASAREALTNDATVELSAIYSTFFLAPKDLVVFFDGEVIQGK